MKKIFSYAMPLAVMLCVFLLFSCHYNLEMPEEPSSSSKKSSSSVQKNSSSSESPDDTSSSSK